MRAAARIRRLSRFALIPLLLGLFGACECDPSLSLLRPTLLVEPDEVNVTGAGVAQDTPILITLRNPSNVPLRVENVALEDNHDPAFRLVEWPTEVLAGGEALARVMVRPELVSTITTTLFITAEPGALPVPNVEVPISVQALDLGLPKIRVEPDCIEFERIGQFDVAFSSVEISNDGVRDLLIDEVLFEPAVPGDTAISVQGGVPPGFAVAPGESVTVTLTFAPQDTLTHEGDLVIRSNDPESREVRVCVSGTGSECPIAVAELLEDPEDIEPLDTIRFYGGDSYTETQDVEIEQHRWRMTVRPTGSTAVLSSPEAEQTQLTVDIAGTYEVCLEVLDTDGIRSCNDACTRVDVIPTDALHVQLVWDHPRADLDLHILKEGGNVFTHEGDCYFSNREPEWFEPLAANPTLDADDDQGYGPENSNIEAPLPGSRWRVLVHYWNKQTDGDAFTVATLRVYAYGQLIGEFPHSFEDDEVLWRAVEVQWSDVPPTPDQPIGEMPSLNVIGQTEPFERPFGG